MDVTCNSLLWRATLLALVGYPRHTLISVISIGGIISAMAALIWPLAGSVITWLLYYPTHGLIVLVEFSASYQEILLPLAQFLFAVAGMG